MPPRTGGMRKPTEEKALLAELSKMFHVAKANHKEHQNARSAQPATTDASAKERKTSTTKHTKDTRAGSKRRSAHGGSIWMVLKGGFGPHAVPLASQQKTVDARAQQRAQLSERKRVAALKAAEAYVESAWQQAKESELVTADGIPTEDGDAYLAEQYAIASRMLAPPAAGSFLHDLVESHSGNSGGSSDVTAATVQAEPSFLLNRAEWEDVCTREAAVLFRYRTSATPAGEADDYFKAQQQARARRYAFATAEPTSTAAITAAVDGVPTKCIVRIRDSQRNKHTAVLSTAKALNYFKSNIGQVLRKELAGSKLARGGAEDADGSVAGAAAGGTSSMGGSKSTGASNNNSSSAAANSSKKKRKR